ncbi:hypothetical protein GX50_02050 [[Emmonsia] crescens]|uniref:Uncharacterized protein n=1 Tax=[Emmonsia] crescens TaxID=73230 RepID=A0A2B7ZPK1_9EURO|nr:hypothetical protein GX50_02050 [Emmonsia crescens]
MMVKLAPCTSVGAGAPEAACNLTPPRAQVFRRKLHADRAGKLYDGILSEQDAEVSYTNSKRSTTTWLRARLPTYLPRQYRRRRAEHWHARLPADTHPLTVVSPQQRLESYIVSRRNNGEHERVEREHYTLINAPFEVDNQALDLSSGIVAAAQMLGVLMSGTAQNRNHTLGLSHHYAHYQLPPHLLRPSKSPCGGPESFGRRWTVTRKCSLERNRLTIT